MNSTMKIHTNGFRFLAAMLALVLAAAAASGQATEPFSLDRSPLPQPTEPVNDFAGVLSPATVERLNRQIKDFKARTNPPVVLAVAIVKTTDGRPIEEYSLAVYRGWKIGTMNDDNPGALLFLAVEDRRYFTQVGRDLEDELPDGVAGQLQRQYLVPALKQGNYDKGVSDTIEAYMRTIEGKTGGLSTNASPTPTPNIPKGNAYPLSSIFCCLVTLLVVFLVISSIVGKFRGKSKKDRDRWGGGGFGSSGGGWVFLPGSGFGGDSSSSSSWGGSSDWGGGSSDWGGFGGGDAGGGGAGGDW